MVFGATKIDVYYNQVKLDNVVASFSRGFCS